MLELFLRKKNLSRQGFLSIFTKYRKKKELSFYIVKKTFPMQPHSTNVINEQNVLFLQRGSKQILSAFLNSNVPTWSGEAPAWSAPTMQAPTLFYYFQKKKKMQALRANYTSKNSINKYFQILDTEKTVLNKNYSKFVFSGKKNRIRTKASIINNNLDKLISIEYSLDNFHRSNQDTCLVHKPSVFEGQWVQSGDLLADCSASVGGELALGQNILIAYMPWEGYNFEDAILVSERLVYDDLYTSIHIERYELELRQTKQGIEEITREIPEVSEYSLKHLNNFGIAKLGSLIQEGDILVGKVTPVNKKIQSNYQKLLYTILEKTVLPFRDSSLRAPKGIKAKVIGVQVFKHSKNNLISDSVFTKHKKLEDLNFVNKAKSNLNVFGPPAPAWSAPTMQALEGLRPPHKKKKEPDFDFFNKFLKLYSSKKLNKREPSIINPFLIKDNSNGSRSNRDREFITLKSLSMREPPKPLSHPTLLSPIMPVSPPSSIVSGKLKTIKAMKQLISKNKKIFINKNYFFFMNQKITKNINSDLEIIKTISFNLINFYRYSSIKDKNKQNKMNGVIAYRGLRLHGRYRPCRRFAPSETIGDRVKKNQILEALHTVPAMEDILSINNSISLLNRNFQNSSLNERLKDVSSIQIYLAEKRRLQVGDKMAGRHGNKGIISQILPIEDMPFLPDGKPLDMVLNPLGVPSRMNVGQIYECLLGLAGKYLGQHFKIFPFDEMYGAEASRSFVFAKLYDARIKTGKQWLFNQKAPGKIRLYDGRTGETFDQSITVGYAYMLRLVHMVDDKIHARSTGPYSLVTQQPLRGRSKQGGQRLGEMEVWALEGYGAAFTLLEMLTIKSDDMNGRMTLWSNLILNKEISIGTPESFKVLICELQALCLDIGLFKVI